MCPRLALARPGASGVGRRRWPPGDGFASSRWSRDGTVLISFSLADGYTDDVRAAIKSGLKTTFTYTVDLRAEVPAWIDRTIASAVVSTSVQYDNLTRRHTVVRTLDGRVEEAQVMEDDAEVRQLVTTIDRARAVPRP